jgi:hypothetical protein
VAFQVAYRHANNPNRLILASSYKLTANFTTSTLTLTPTSSDADIMRKKQEAAAAKKAAESGKNTPGKDGK